ncbi:alkylphosphonate utilization protein [Campylobacter fetus]|uniref:alkylphosphonate utilization protein n=1 Tax=Campylobacter fetus TaxID=196 RepID=UPI00053109A3|nr:alkylphosphonate utilization protein [Campylobacter fetus]EAI5647897.1 alkylphosphonate utilization protein [Campylobacter fetus]EAI5946016.1 alkylphosphonate utilization protein [Campylobacter fetus]EAJ0318720.1 alkylphosphonate utilization protein [Campylobacter fetus]EAJ0345440.1 alkylphosphonate utilization protein [Campylobacter fetus]EAJ1238067.1 alkylphosphonate utilization protein [Campylobacter fetus]
MAKDSINNADSVTVIKDLKIKGASATIKRGTTVKNIKLISKDNEVECKIPGIGTVVLKTEFLKKI